MKSQLCSLSLILFCSAECLAANGLAPLLADMPDETDLLAPRPASTSLDFGIPGGGVGESFSQLPGWPQTMGRDPWAAPTRGIVWEDLDHDGHPEVIASSTDGKVYVWDSTGTPLQGWPQTLNSWAQTPPSIGDIDNDGRNEVVFDSNLTVGGQGHLNAVDEQGNYLGDWPLRPLGFTYMNGSVLGDINDDGLIDVGSLSVDDFNAYVNIWSLGAPYSPDRIEWAQYHSDREHTGLYHAPGGGAPVTVDIEPEHLVRAPGETCTYDVTLANQTNEEQRFQVWVNLRRAESNTLTLNPILGPKEVRLLPGQTAVGSITERVPNFAPARTYTLNFQAGLYEPRNVYDNDEVLLEVTD